VEPLIVGTSPADASRTEFRIFAGQEHAVTFVGNAVKKFSVKKSVGKLPPLEGTLVLPDAALGVLIQERARIEVWVTEGDGSTRTFFVGQIDFVELSKSRGKRALAEIEARGLAARLVDAPFSGRLQGSPKAVLMGIASQHSIRAEATYPPEEIDVWMNGKSSYGLIRLLAVNLGAVVRTDADWIKLISYEEVRRQLAAPPKAKLDLTNARATRLTQGTRVRR
jgi:hypothetical protein